MTPDKTTNGGRAKAHLVTFLKGRQWPRRIMSALRLGLFLVPFLIPPTARLMIALLIKPRSQRRIGAATGLSPGETRGFESRWEH